jgi:hypothetical protein
MPKKPKAHEEQDDFIGIQVTPEEMTPGQPADPARVAKVLRELQDPSSELGRFLADLEGRQGTSGI